MPVVMLYMHAGYAWTLQQIYAHIVNEICTSVVYACTHTYSYVMSHSLQTTCSYTDRCLQMTE